MPSIRATQVKSDLEALEDLGADVRDRVLARLPGDFPAQIADASRLDWIPLPVVTSLCRAVRQETDEDGLRRWCRAATNLSLQTPLFGPIISGAVAIFGRDPQRIFKVLPTGWNAAMRACGELKVDVTAAGRVVLEIHHVPDEMRDRDLLLAIGGSFEVVFDECRTDGRCELEVRPPAEAPRYVARWPLRVA